MASKYRKCMPYMASDYQARIVTAKHGWQVVAVYGERLPSLGKATKYGKRLPNVATLS